MPLMHRWIGITLGDVTGIGPEVTLKALATDPTADNTRFLLIGDAEVILRLDQKLGLELEPSVYTGPESVGRIFITNPLTDLLPRGLRPGSIESAHAAVAWLREGARRCLAGELDALVTSPVSKEAILRAGYTFVGQTEFLSDLAGAERIAMMLLGQDDRDRWLRVVLVTTHVPLKDVPTRITQAKVELAIDLAVQSCRDLGLPRGRVAVCGLNPHAGEGGHFGDEELLVITPAILATRKKQLDVVGPLSGDTAFHHALRGDFDVVVAMYHDQGLAPLKAVAFDRGVNWTLGLPFIRTSPDHGTAYDIAGRGMANPSSMIAAIRLAKLLSRARHRR